MLHCPTCKEEFDFYDNMVYHIEQKPDKQHKLLNILRKQRFNGTPDLDKLYNDNIEMFDVEVFEKKIEVIQINKNETVDINIQPKKQRKPRKSKNNENNEIVEIKETKETKKPKPNKQVDELDVTNDENSDVVKATCEIETTCNDCYRYSSEKFSKCKKHCKQILIRKFSSKLSKEPIIITDEINIDPYRDIENTKNEIIYGMAPALVNYFYSKIKTLTEQNPSKEIPQVFRLLAKYTPDEIKLTMQNLLAKGCTNLAYLNYNIGEAILERKYLVERNKEGTTSYLVNYYYKAFKLPVIKSKFIQDVNRLNALINEGLSYNNAKLTIEHMIKTNCNIFAYINGRAVEISNFQKTNNSEYNDIKLIIFKLKQVKMGLKQVDQESKDIVIKELIKIYENNEYNDQYSPLEWAFRIGLPLSKEMYIKGKEIQLNRESIFDIWVNNEFLGQEKIDKINSMRLNFEKWLEEYENKYNS